MSRNFFVKERQRAKQNLLTMITANPTIPKKRLIAAYSMKTGFTFKKIEEYLSELLDAQLVRERIDTVGEVYISAVKLEGGE